MEEETEMELWDDEYPCDNPSPEKTIKTTDKTCSKMNKLKNWPTWALLLSAASAVVIIIWKEQYKDAAMAWIAISVPLSILLWQMKENNKQYKNTVEIDRINQIRIQGANFVSSLNHTDLIQFANKFLFECDRLSNASVFSGQELYDDMKSIIDNVTKEYLKLSLLVSYEERKSQIFKNIKKWQQYYIDTIIQFNCIVIYMEDNYRRIIPDEFELFWKLKAKPLFSEELLNWNNKDGISAYSANYVYDSTTDIIGSIYNFAKDILYMPINFSAPSSISEIVQDLISDYCDNKEKELLAL